MDGFTLESTAAFCTTPGLLWDLYDSHQQFQRSSLISNPSVVVLGEKTTTLSADFGSARGTSLLPAGIEGLLMSEAFTHVPVMLDEVLHAILNTPDLPVIDATLGGGGHAKAILEHYPERRLIGLDQDKAAIAAASERLGAFDDRVSIHHARFDQIARIAHQEGVSDAGASIVLFDLGVSSHQLDTAARGFSYQKKGPLDMRMDPTRGQTAAEYLDSATEEQLSALFYVNGETRFARKIARTIIAERPITTTLELAELVTRVIPIPARRRGHPARRVFQALRVVINEELYVLGNAIDEAITLLAPGGKIIVLSYHSGEDRITKDHLLFGSTGGCQCPPGLPCVCGAVPTLRLLNRGARMASVEEIALNSRAKSVRLRIAERLDPTEVAGRISWR